MRNEAFTEWAYLQIEESRRQGQSTCECNNGNKPIPKKKKSEKNEQSFSNLKYNVMHTNTHKWSPREQEQSGKNIENTLSLGKS